MTPAVSPPVNRPWMIAGLVRIQSSRAARSAPLTGARSPGRSSTARAHRAKPAASGGRTHRPLILTAGTARSRRQRRAPSPSSTAFMRSWSDGCSAAIASTAPRYPCVLGLARHAKNPAQSVKRWQW